MISILQGGKLRPRKVTECSQTYSAAKYQGQHLSSLLHLKVFSLKNYTGQVSSKLLVSVKYIPVALSRIGHVWTRKHFAF